MIKQLYLLIGSSIWGVKIAHWKADSKPHQVLIGHFCKFLHEYLSIRLLVNSVKYYETEGVIDGWMYKGRWLFSPACIPGRVSLYLWKNIKKIHRSRAGRVWSQPGWNPHVEKTRAEGIRGGSGGSHRLQNRGSGPRGQAPRRGHNLRRLGCFQAQQLGAPTCPPNWIVIHSPFPPYPSNTEYYRRYRSPSLLQL